MPLTFNCRVKCTNDLEDMQKSRVSHIYQMALIKKQRQKKNCLNQSAMAYINRQAYAKSNASYKS